VLNSILDTPTRFLFFTGKGGVGKTSLSCAAAVTLADRGAKVLLVSTDPASNLSEVLGTNLGNEPQAVPGVDRLWALDIDPMAAAAAYRQRVVGPYRGVLPDKVVEGIEEQLSGSCTVEIAAFDQFTGLLADPADFDHVIFDTAPTGHTLRMLALPGAWTSYLDTNEVGVTCVGPLSGLTQQRARYREALDVLSDPALATLVLVTRPDNGAMAEASRASGELADTGLSNQLLVVNGVYPGNPPGTVSDPTAIAFAKLQKDALAAIPSNLQGLDRELVGLMDTPPLGIGGLRRLLQPRLARAATEAESKRADLAAAPEPGLATLVDAIARKGHGLVMTMGKGGVGKTTIAASIAVAVARRGVPVILSTTDPAAHLSGVLGDAATLPTNLIVERIDPADLTKATPCPAFDVSALISHIVGAANRAVELGRGETPSDYEFPDVELSDAPDGLRQARKEAEAAWSDDLCLTRSIKMPWGEVYSGSNLVDMYFMELATHTWDLAFATGHIDALGADLPTEALVCAKSIMRPDYRNDEGTPFGLEVQAPTDATDWELLAAFMGRQPRPTP